MTPKIYTILLPLCGAALLCGQPAQAAPTKSSRNAKTTKPAKKPTRQTKPAKQEENSPSKHEKFPDFIQALDKMVEENSTDYYDAVRCALNATGGDETAVNSWMHAAAQKGNAAAQRWEISQKLASLDQTQLLTPPIKSAYQQIVKLADQGYVPSMLDKSACQRMGIGTIKDEIGAQRTLMEACKGGDFKARFQWLLDTKRLTNFNDREKPEVAAEINRGNHFVIYHLSSLAPDDGTQVEWIKNAAGKGSGDAYLLLSTLTAENHPKESLTLLRMAAMHLHHPEAVFTLASAIGGSGTPAPFQQKAGITPDEKESIMLMKTAALLSSARAALVLGGSYYDGMNGLPKDPKMAYFHYNNPFVANIPAAKAARGLLLMLGEGVKKDAKEGYRLVQEAAQSSPPAGILQAWALYKGVGVTPDAKAAANLLKEAAATGAPVAYIYLAYIYAKGGAGLPEDAEEAKRYIRLASLDMGDKAQQLYDALIAEGDWKPHP